MTEYRAYKLSDSAQISKMHVFLILNIQARIVKKDQPDISCMDSIGRKGDIVFFYF